MKDLRDMKEISMDAFLVEGEVEDKIDVDDILKVAKSMRNILSEVHTSSYNSNCAV
jgi:hypothetical protein